MGGRKRTGCEHETSIQTELSEAMEEVEENLRTERVRMPLVGRGDLGRGDIHRQQLRNRKPHRADAVLNGAAEEEPTQDQRRPSEAALPGEPGKSQGGDQLDPLQDHVRLQGLSFFEDTL